MTFTSSNLIRLKAKISGKTVLVFGATFVGKTTLAVPDVLSIDIEQ